MKIWGNSYDENFNLKASYFTTSIQSDKHLVDYEVWVGLTHIIMLYEAGVIPENSGRRLLSELVGVLENESLKQEIVNFGPEDIHLNMELWLTYKLGQETAGWYSTAKSRNAKVNVIIRMYLRDSLLLIFKNIGKICLLLKGRANEYLDQPMLGLTHCRPAQPISVGFWWSNYLEVFLRILNRTIYEIGFLDVNTLGAGALAGTTLPIDVSIAQNLLGFSTSSRNALDAVSSHDFGLSFLGHVANIGSTVSKLMGDVIYLSSPNIGIVKISDRISMGSSLMPQKKNPSLLEITRAKCARTYGDIQSAYSILHGLEHGYNRDYQILKEVYINSTNQIIDITEILKLIIDNVDFPTGSSLGDFDLAFATELANLIMLRSKLSFRESYNLVGDIVFKKLCKDAASISDELKGKGIGNISVLDVEEVLNYDKHLFMYRSYGSANPNEVKINLQNAAVEYNKYVDAISKIENGITRSRNKCIQDALKYI